MEFIAPIPFREAIDKLGSQQVIGSTFTSSEWRDVPLELRDNAFFSSRIESARVLQRAKDLLGDFIAGNRKTLPDGQSMLSVGSRSAFVDQMQKFLEAEGIKRTTGDLQDITSEARLGIIFDVKVQQAQNYGYWLQGLAPDVLDEFPAQRFIRVRDVVTPRQLHVLNEDEVRLKTDVDFWLAMNSPLLGGFGVPYGPWGFNSGMDTEDVDRDEAESLGLIKPGQRLDTAPLKRFMNLNQNLQASTKTMDDDLVQKLLNEFGDRIQYDEQQRVIRWAAAQQNQQPPKDDQGNTPGNAGSSQ